MFEIVSKVRFLQRALWEGDPAAYVFGLDNNSKGFVVLAVWCFDKEVNVYSGCTQVW